MASVCLQGDGGNNWRFHTYCLKIICSPNLAVFWRVRRVFLSRNPEFKQCFTLRTIRVKDWAWDYKYCHKCFASWKIEIDTWFVHIFWPNINDKKKNVICPTCASSNSCIAVRFTFLAAFLLLLQLSLLPLLLFWWFPRELLSPFCTTLNLLSPPPHLVAIFLIPSLPTPHSTLIPGQCSLYRAYPCTLPLPSFPRGCLLLPHDRHVPFIRPQSDPPYTLPPSSISNLLDSYYIHYVYILLPSKLTLRIPYPNFYFFAFFSLSHTTGFEPSIPASKAIFLPLNHAACCWNTRLFFWVSLIVGPRLISAKYTKALKTSKRVFHQGDIKPAFMLQKFLFPYTITSILQLSNLLLIIVRYFMVCDRKTLKHLMLEEGLEYD